MNTISIPTTQHIELEYPIAGIGDRLLAGLIDLLVVGLYAGSWAYLLINYDQVSGEELFEGEVSVVWILLLLPINLYTLLCEWLFDGRTLGKWIMKTRTIGLNGAAPTLSQYLLRWIFRLIDVWLSAGVLLPGLVGLIAMGINRKGQRLGDLIAGTTVIKLKLVTTFMDTIYIKTEENYQVQFPEIANLSDRDVSILKEVLDAGIKSKNPQLIARLADKVKEVGQIQSDMQPLPFLETVLQDYNHLFSK